MIRKSYAEIWNRTYGLEKDPVRMYLLFPRLIKLSGNLRNKTILDAGCGNGSLINQLIKKGPKKIVGIDIDNEFLRFAKGNINSDKIELIKRDLRIKLPFQKNSFDLAYSIFVLDSMNIISTHISEISRTLKNNGKFYLVIRHPFYASILYLQEKLTGKQNKKIIGVGNYFKKYKADYILTIAKDKTPYYHRTLSDYANVLIKNNLKITGLTELSTNKKLIDKFPRYREDKDIPKFLIIEATKSRKS
jgi:ubiquinone/menaquinone biosynthesis C-methylase UbiE